MTEYEALKVAELKEQLRERGLTVSGKKAELIARLQENDEQQVQPRCQPSRCLQSCFLCCFIRGPCRFGQLLCY